MERFAVYGKGGIGKSVIATGLSAYFAKRGQRVLHVGCDPKRDSSLRLLGRMPERTVIDFLGMDSGAVVANRLINEGRDGVHCIESGGPEPGLGCGGRGVARAIEILDEIELLETGGYDVVVFDVLGDVVCGGFAAPLRRGFAQKVLIVASNEPMALFAANNIARAVVTYGANGVVLAGIVANRMSSGEGEGRVGTLAAKIGTTVLASIPRDEEVIEAERRCLTVFETAPEGPAARALGGLALSLERVVPSRLSPPTPLAEREFFELMQSG